MATTYYNTNYTFDVNEFNADFDKYLEEEKNKREVKEQRFLEAKDFEKKPKKIHELSLFEIMINMKNSVFDVIDDIVSMNISSDTFLKDNNLLYLGLLFFIFGITLYILDKVSD